MIFFIDCPFDKEEELGSEQLIICDRNDKLERNYKTLNSWLKITV